MSIAEHGLEKYRDIFICVRLRQILLSVFIYKFRDRIFYPLSFSISIFYHRVNENST